jgi:chitinase
VVSRKIRRWAIPLLAVGAAAALLPLALPASAAATRYEAESATLSQATVATNHTGFSGSGFVDYTNVTGSYVEWTVNASAAGTATLSFRYANGTTVDRPMSISVNGTVVKASQSFAGTANWDTWQTATVTAPVHAGANTVRATATTANGGPNVDWLEADVAASTPGTELQAETATLSQATVATNHTGFTGSGFVDYTNVAGGFIEWSFNAAAAGSATVVVRYANGTTANRPLDISVNGGPATSAPFAPTANWDTWADASVTVPLNAGTNLIRATATGAAGGPNVDKITVNAATGSPGPDTQPPTAPPNLHTTAVTSTSVTLAWSASTDNVGVTAYDVYNGATLATTVSGTSATINGLSPATTYNFSVKARDAAGNASPASTVSATTSPSGGGASMAVAPYEYFGWGNPQNPTDAMAATGIKFFTLAFMLSDGGCNPAWDGDRPLTGGDDQSKINAIRGKGGDIIVSFGGASGNKLGEHCSSASALAGAYQKVINAYNLKAIDIDIEATEASNATVRQRVIDALKIVKNNNAGIKEFVTFGVATNGPDSVGKDLINRGAAAGLTVDGWTIMPFDFGGHSGSMGQVTINASEGLKNAVKSAYGYTDAVAYQHIGISSMNGKTDESDETVSLGDFQTILGYAQQHHIARLTFWSLNRDRQCGPGLDGDSCSGVSQSPYAYTKVIVQYTG